MRTIKFRISDLNNHFMETTLLKKLESLDDYFDLALNRSTQEVSISPRSFQPVSANHVDRELDWALKHSLI